VKIYDSLGQSYEAAITYTKTGNNTWSYSISLPDTLTPASSAAATISNTGGVAGLTQSSTTAAGVTTLSYNFSSSGGKLATVDPGTTLTITGATGGVPATATVGPLAVTANESLSTYAAALQAAINGSTITAGSVTVTATAGGQLAISGPSATLAVAGIVKQDLTGTTTTYDFGMNGATMATVDPGTNLTITGATASGGTATITAPTVTAGTTATAYVGQLNALLTTAGITGVTVSGPTATGQVTITSLGTSGSLIQDAVGSANTSGTLTFDTSGNLLTPAANVGNITFAGLSDNAATMNMTWDLYGKTGTGTISQTSVTTSSQSAETANGYATGTYNGTFAVGSDGTITATYSNSQTQIVGQLALATVSNLQGLADVGSTEYEVTGASGVANVGVAGTMGLGTLEGSSLEASNVNISAQFSDLIVAQRAFEANAKSVTTFDSITQETINMIH
jgi:flagellar hook protein FlgE